MDAFFDELGRNILSRWKQENFSLVKFPKIASAALDQRPPAKHVDLSKLMHDFLLVEEQPLQSDSPFGEPEIVVYNHPRFYIQLLFWLDGTTEIHQHEFSGAFHVMQGSSIHAHYEFKNSRAITPYLRIGDLTLLDMQLLETGRTVPIISGQQVIHSLFHLDSPSITVVVRTQHDPGTGPQLNYMPPHIAFDPHFSDFLTMRRKQLLDVLERTEDIGYAELVLAMIADLDFERGFSVLYHCMSYLQQIDQWNPALATFRKKHGKLANGVGASLDEDRRRGSIKSWRSDITDPEHRFFLALLMNAQTRADLLALVSRRFPKQDPIAIILRWVEELTEESEEGVSILDATFPKSIEIAIEMQRDLFTAAFAHFLKGGKNLPTIMRKCRANEIKAIKIAFARSSMAALTA